ncbi:hypothetical protein ElyMa_006934700 [Elysia marginata]|uniref:Uncharacterized protein n=1 Tax=Elysia marginata TaxID=1093978 RepID=A0AAV4JLH6_9GAST|nr:hypothetical protein ElyMa_006934700 [Elysia marginata]
MITKPCLISVSSDSDFAPRSNRLASLVSNMRRGSNGSVSRLSAVLAGADSMHDVSAPELKKTSKVSPVPSTPTSLSPSDALASKRAKLQKTRRKSLFDLLKATRQSNAQSVVHRNGDMIIMKGGKIVSVHRREQPKEKNDLLDRLAKLAQTAAINEQKPPPAANGQQTLKVPLQTEIPVIKTVLEQSSDRHSETAKREGDLKATNISSKETEAEVPLHQKNDSSVDGDKRGSRYALSVDKNIPQQDTNTTQKKYLSHNRSTEDNHSLHQTNGKTKLEEGGAIKPSKNSEPGLSTVDKNRAVPQTAAGRRVGTVDKPTFDFPERGDTATPAIFINLDDEDHVTGVIPLSPVTQEHLQRAVQLKESSPAPDLEMSLKRDLLEHRHFERQRDKQGHLSPSRHGRLYSGASAVSRSSEDVSAMGQRLLRLPSVEYLDPPSRLWASNSSASLRAPSFDAWKKQLASSRPHPSNSRLPRLHLPSMKRIRHPSKQDKNTQL